MVGTKIQEQVEFVLPLTGKPVVMHGYMTGRARQAVTAAYIDNTPQLPATSNQKEARALATKTLQSSHNRGQILNAAINAAIDVLVLSLDGSTEDVLARVLELPATDYDFLETKVKEVRDAKLDPKAFSASRPATSTGEKLAN